MNQQLHEQIDRMRLEELNHERQPDSETSLALDQIKREANPSIQRSLLWNLLATILSKGIEIGLSINKPKE